jgi:hypothetical protein
MGSFAFTAMAGDKGQKHDASFISTALGITVMTCPPAASRSLGEDLHRYCLLKKHQMKLGRWVGYGGWSGPKEAIQVAVVFSDPWQPNEELDALVATLPSAGVEGNFDGRAEARRRQRHAAR